MEKPRFLSKAEREKLKETEEKPEEKPKVNSFFSKSTSKPTTAPVKEVHPIKEQYLEQLAPKPPKKRRLNKKFVFDWNAEEDTSVGRDYQPIMIKQSKPTFKMDDRHWSEKMLSEMTERDWRIFREDYEISVRGGTVPPFRSWKESTIPSFILDAVEKLGYRDPTPIQRQAIPLALAQRDIIGIAETGSGKTASFMIPILSLISNMPPLDYSNMHLGPYALVLAPTRELALQIETEAKKLCSSTKKDIVVVSIVGGHSMTTQTHTMIHGTHIIIATPGRLVDLVDKRMVALSQCYFVVLDEADRMCDLGFEESLQKILNAMPATNLKPDTELAEDPEWLMNRTSRYRQTVMFSATMPTAVEKLANKYLRRPATVIVGQVGQVVDRIDQRVELINDEHVKLKRLRELVREFPAPIIVFVNLKKTVETVGRFLDNEGVRVSTLHGGKSQDAREYALESIKNGKKDVLIATDVAGRGIDIKNVKLVVNFDMAKNIQGRTGRAGEKGTAITFWGNQDSEVLFDLKTLLQKSKCPVPPELAKHPAAMAKPTITIKK